MAFSISVLVPSPASGQRDLLGKLRGFGSENTRTGKTFPVTFKAKRKHSGELCWWLVEGVGSEGGKGKLFYLVFLAGAKPGGFMVCLH